MKKILLILILFTSCNIGDNSNNREDNILDISFYTPVEVTDYFQTPGFYSMYEEFSIEKNTRKLLGFPVGGGSFAPDHSSVVSLGEAGGYVVVKFDPPIDNLASYDFTVFGNSFFVGGDINQPNIEFGIVEVMEDLNNNDLPDDGWNILIHPENRGSIERGIKTYSKDDYPENQWTLGSGDSYFIDIWEITSEVTYKGFADSNPTINSDNESYTIADAPLGDIDPQSGGGDAFDLDWALSSTTMEPVVLSHISWIKISTASFQGRSNFETEIDAVVRVKR